MSCELLLTDIRCEKQLTISPGRGPVRPLLEAFEGIAITSFTTRDTEIHHLHTARGTFGYRRFGPTGGVPLLLFMRFRGTIDHWDPLFLDLLAERHDVIVFDNVGIGHTPGLAPATIAEVADDASTTWGGRTAGPLSKP